MIQRPRNLRSSPLLRALVRETTLAPSNFIQPLFVRPGKNERRPIKSMPGNFQLSVDQLVKEGKRTRDAGVPAVILFGIPEKKDARASSGTDPDGIIPRAVKALKDGVPGLLVATDVCLCEYTDHGHCGIVEGHRIANDASLPVLAAMAAAHAKAGADLVAPSDMMDGRVAAIRARLDETGFADTPIMAYSAKYASAFYGPFRDAAESPPKFGDRATYQMDPANALEALREVELDLAEGADIVMVKPALPYLDVIRRVKDRFQRPTAAYCVSGEFSMVKAAGAAGWLDEKRAALEILTSIRRAGADLIVTYWATEAAGWLK
ncbi:MAG: porphobilinogen synthase [Planctomycetes bacterium]|nr:porphobilinogen synthase [Planctomycetota bacterium]